VLEETLAAAVAADGIDAAMAVVRHAEDAPIVATLGMTAEEASRQPVSSSPSGGARSVRISYRYDKGGEPEEEPGRLIRGGVAVPLQGGRIGTIGTLAVFWRGEDRGPEDDEIAELRPEDDSIALFQRADDALSRAKEGGKGEIERAEVPPGRRALEPGSPA
jgi:hypothetical protein